MRDLISSVSKLLQEAAQTCVMPVFGKREADPKEKSPGEWVTEADRASEAFLIDSRAMEMYGSSTHLMEHQTLLKESRHLHS